MAILTAKIAVFKGPLAPKGQEFCGNDLVVVNNTSGDVPVQWNVQSDKQTSCH